MVQWTMLVRIRHLLGRASRLLPFRARGVVEFGTARYQTSKGLSSERHRQLLQAAAMLRDVESSPLIRQVDPTLPAPADQDRVGGLEIRAAGGLGTVWIPCSPPCELRDDIDGLQLEVAGSDGSPFEAYCAGRSADNDGVAIRFVFAPAPSPTTAWIRVSLDPFPVRRPPSRIVVVEATLA